MIGSHSTTLESPAIGMIPRRCAGSFCCGGASIALARSAAGQATSSLALKWSWLTAP